MTKKAKKVSGKPIHPYLYPAPINVEGNRWVHKQELLDIIIETVNFKRNQIVVKEYKGRCKKEAQHIVTIVSHIYCTKTSATQKMIAEILGKTDHSTISYHKKKAKNLLEVDPSFRQFYKSLWLTVVEKVTLHMFKMDDNFIEIRIAEDATD